MTDKLAEEMDRRVDAIESPPFQCPKDIDECIRMVKKYCDSNRSTQIFRHSSIYLIEPGKALVIWD